LLFVKLLQQRLQLADVLQKGFVLDGYPRTKAQALMLEQFGIHATNVVYCQLDENHKINRINRVTEAIAKAKGAKKQVKEEEKEEEEDGPKKDRFDSILAAKAAYEDLKIGLYYQIMNLRQNQQFLDDLKLQTYFVSKFNNLILVDTKVSKWGCLDLAKTFILGTVKVRQNVVSPLISGAVTDHSRARLHKRLPADSGLD